MRTVGIKILKNRLSEYVHLAAQGETVLISDRDRVVAQMVAPQAGHSAPVSDAVLAELVRVGVLMPAIDASKTPPPKPRARGKLRDVLAALDQDRNDR